MFFFRNIASKRKVLERANQLLEKYGWGLKQTLAIMHGTFKAKRVGHLTLILGYLVLTYLVINPIPDDELTYLFLVKHKAYVLASLCMLCIISLYQTFVLNITIKICEHVYESIKT